VLFKSNSPKAKQSAPRQIRSKKTQKKTAPKRGSFLMQAWQLNPAQQHQYQQDHQDRTDDARRTVAPASGVREYRKSTDQQQDKDDDQNCADAHDEFLLVFLEDGYAVQEVAITANHCAA
jgi:hypothetical protein